jgi:hypothetical protein
MCFLGGNYLLSIDFLRVTQRCKSDDSFLVVAKYNADACILNNCIT